MGEAWGRYAMGHIPHFLGMLCIEAVGSVRGKSAAATRNLLNCLITVLLSLPSLSACSAV